MKLLFSVDFMRTKGSAFDTKEEAQAQYQRALAIIDTCTREDLVELRIKHSPYARRKK